MLYQKYSKSTKTQIEGKGYQAKLLDFLNKIDGGTFGQLFKYLKGSPKTLSKYLKHLKEEGLIILDNRRYRITNKGTIHLVKLREQENIRSITSTHAFMIGTNDCSKPSTAPSSTAFWDMYSQQKLELDEEDKMKKTINECGQKIYDMLPKKKIRKGVIIFHLR